MYNPFRRAQKLALEREQVAEMIAAESTKMSAAVEAMVEPLLVSPNCVEVSVDMGLIAINNKTVTVTGLPWVRATSILIAAPKASDGSGETVAARRWSAVVTEVTAGTGFKLSVHAPLLAAGSHTFRVMEVAW